MLYYLKVAMRISEKSHPYPTPGLPGWWIQSIATKKTADLSQNCDLLFYINSRIEMNIKSKQILDKIFAIWYIVSQK